MAISRFRRGSAVYACTVCGRQTRYTGAQPLGQRTCPQCYDLAGIENEIRDHYSTLDENRATIDRLIDEVASKGGDVSAWRTTFQVEPALSHTE